MFDCWIRHCLWSNDLHDTKSYAEGPTTITWDVWGRLHHLDYWLLSAESSLLSSWFELCENFVTLQTSYSQFRRTVKHRLLDAFMNTSIDCEMTLNLLKEILLLQQLVSTMLLGDSLTVECVIINLLMQWQKSTDLNNILFLCMYLVPLSSSIELSIEIWYCSSLFSYFASPLCSSLIFKFNTSGYCMPGGGVSRVDGIRGCSIV